mgnify:CR=1 FL=1
MARPSHKPDGFHRRQVEALAGYGVPEAEIAGMLIAETEYHSEVEVVTAPLRGLALGVFLIAVGMSLDLPSLMNNWPQVFAALALVLVAKVLVTGFLLWFAGSRLAVAAETALLMASPSETTSTRAPACAARSTSN